MGLLVLDEVFGPLDEDRKERMLLALERLRGRFRQVVVVTHASEIKEQLPNAVEVVKLPARRATARLLKGELMRYGFAAQIATSADDAMGAVPATCTAR